MRISTKRYQNILSDAFPGMSLALVRFLKQKNRRSKVIPRWRVRQVQNFVMALNSVAFELERARKECRMATLAWSGRNFLELSIWTSYCCTSEENAKRFKEDTSRDLFGIVAAGKGADLRPELHKNLDALLQRLERIFNTPTFKITDNFKRVRNAAAELGRERQFLADNAVFIRGAALGLESMLTLMNFFLAHFPDPNLKWKLNGPLVRFKSASTSRP